MLSPGKHHERVPRTLHANLVYRRKILDAADGDPGVQRELKRMCQEDCLFYINTFVWQFNPSKSLHGAAAVHPFITFRAQERTIVARPETHRGDFNRGILWCIDNNKTGALEKSRWQGASWLCLMVEDWLCGFHRHVKILNISRNEEAVDDGTTDSLFWKIRYMHDQLPEWLMGEIETSKLYFKFQDTQSENTGTATTKKAGVGGRATWIVADEFPEIHDGQAIREKTALTADSRLFVGTHLGVGTPFQIMCDPKKSPEIVRMRIHWTENPEQFEGAYQYNPLDPDKPVLLDPGYKHPSGYRFVLNGTPSGGPRPGVRSPWYDRKCVEIASDGDTRAIAANLDINPEGSAKQFFDAIRIQGLIENCQPPLWIGDIDYDPAGRFRKLVEDPEGRLKLWSRPVHDGQILVRSTYCVGNDIAAGTGATPSCAAIIDAIRGVKIGEYANPFIEEKEFARFVVALCRWLFDAKLVWDSSGQQGVKFETEVLRLGYLNYYHQDDDVSHLNRIGQSAKSKRPGWYSEPKQHYRVIKDYRDAIYDGTLVDRSEDCLKETMLFEWDAKTGEVKHSGETRTNDPSGARKGHGDRVTATMLGWMLAKEYQFGGRQSIEKVKGPEPYSLEWLELVQSRAEEMLEPYD